MTRAIDTIDPRGIKAGNFHSGGPGPGRTVETIGRAAFTPPTHV